MSFYEVSMVNEIEIDKNVNFAFCKYPGYFKIARETFCFYDFIYSPHEHKLQIKVQNHHHQAFFSTLMSALGELGLLYIQRATKPNHPAMVTQMPLIQGQAPEMT